MEAYLREKDMDAIMRLMSASTYTISIDEPEPFDIFLKSPELFTAIVKKAIIRMIADVQDESIESVGLSYTQLRVEISSNAVDKLSVIKSTSINSPISIRCVITGLDEKKSYIKKAHMECPNGHDVGSINVDVDLKRQIPLRACEQCNSKLFVVPDASSYEYLQYGTIQEPPEDAKDGVTNEYDVVFIGDQTQQINVGSERKEITGILRAIEVQNAKTKNNNGNLFSLLLDTLSVNDSKDKFEDQATPEEMKQYKLDASKDDFLDNLALSYAPEILASPLLHDVKKSIILSLVGGMKFERKRGDINILMLGDPSVAKSSLLKFGSSLMRRSMYTSGKGASVAGLTIGIVKRPNGTSIAQAGIIPLCHKSVAFIDEFDKMNPTDRSGLHEAMEQQTVSISKAGFVMTLPAETVIIAAANPKGGKWDKDMTVLDNVNLTPPLLSRFDLKWRILDIVSETDDERIARHIMSGFENGVKALYTVQQMAKIINAAKKVRPLITQEVVTTLTDFYVHIRKMSKKDEQAIIDTRQLEALIRLSFAYAKIHFRESVTVEDAKSAIKLFTSSFASFDWDLTKGEVHQSTMEETSKMSKDKIWWKTWSLCADGFGFVRPKTFYAKLVELAPAMWDKDSAVAYMNKLSAYGGVRQNADGDMERVEHD